VEQFDENTGFRAGPRKEQSAVGALSVMLLSGLIGLAYVHFDGFEGLPEKIKGSTQVAFDSIPEVEEGFFDIVDITEAKPSSAKKGIRQHEILSRVEIEKIVRGATAQYKNVEPELVLAVIEVESRFNQNAKSRKGAAGLMQLMPGTVRAMKVDDPYHPVLNIYGGVAYLDKMMKRYKGDKHLALAAYNAGPTAVDRHGRVPPFRETQSYVTKVLEKLRENKSRT